MSAKQIVYNRGARSAILHGVNVLADARGRSRSAPRGRNVVIEKSHGAPVVTKDGVTVAKEIELFYDKLENMGAQMVREVASLHERQGRRRDRRLRPCLPRPSTGPASGSSRRGTTRWT